MVIQHLKYFYEVAKRGSFSAAAKSLRVSQPSISKMVKQLEYLEGYTFLDRGKKGVRLTPMGKVLFERCERIFGEFESLKGDLSKRKDECQGELWFGASDNVLNYLLPSKIAQFLRANPEVKVKLFGGASSHILDQVKDYRLELALFYTPVKESGIVTEKLMDVEFIVVNKSKTSLAELSSSTCIGSLANDYKKDSPALNILKKLDLSPKKLIECNVLEVHKRLVLAGTGYSVMPKYMVQNEIKEGSLHRVSTKRDFKLPLLLVYRKNRTLSQVATRWAEFLKKELAS